MTVLVSMSSDPMTTFLWGVRGFVRSLPSDEEGAEILRTLRDTRDFLNEVERLVSSIPTLETSAEMSGAISRLDLLASKARDNRLYRVLGIPKPRSTMKAANDSEVRVRSLGESVRTMEKSEIARSLERSGEPVRVLKAFASNLGLRVRSSERRADLIQRIATHIENERDYRLLRGETPEAASRLPKAKAS